MGPVGHAERCVSANVASLASGGGVRTSWSPLNGEQLDAMCQEAQRVAGQLQCASLLVPPSVPDEATGAFSQDAEAQLAAVDRRASALSPVKRQTFCVQDSPMKQLPPAIRHRLLTERGATTATPTRPGTTATLARPATTATSARPGAITTSTRPATSARPAARQSALSPAAGVRPLPRMGLRGKATLGVAVVLPSKPAAATIPCAAGKRKAERLQPPSKVGEKFCVFFFSVSVLLELNVNRPDNLMLYCPANLYPKCCSKKPRYISNKSRTKDKIFIFLRNLL